MSTWKGFEAKLTHPRCMDARSNGAYIDYGAFGSDNQWCECLRDADHAPDIYFIHAFGRVYIEIQCWHYDRLTGVIY